MKQQQVNKTNKIMRIVEKCEACDQEMVYNLREQDLYSHYLQEIYFCEDCDDDGHDEWLRECGVYQQWDMND